MSNSFELSPTHFSRGGFAPSSNGPAAEWYCNSNISEITNRID